MSNELSELIALSCADLTARPEGSGQIQLIIDSERRLSIKQMTATELANLRAAAAAEAEAQARAQAEAKARALAEEQARRAAEIEAQARARAALEAEQQLHRVMERQRLEAEQQRQQDATPSPSHKGLLPAAEAPRDRLISLPNILDDAMEMHLMNAGEGNAISGDSSPTKSNSHLADSIELLRMQRAARAARSHHRSRERSTSPAERNHERSAAPERLHSSSISSMDSAPASGSVSVSRRGSNASAMSTDLAAELATPSKFPLSKTVSAPNMNRRRSSLSALFPGPAPLVAPEPMLHTNPEMPPARDAQRPGGQEDGYREIPSGKMVHRTKTPPPVGANLGVCLKRVTAPSGSVTIKPKDAPMLGVVLRKVEKKTAPQKSVLDDDKPLYHLSIVRSDNKEYKPAPKPKPKPAPPAAKPSPGGILTGPQVVRTVNRPAVVAKPQRPQPGVPITITRIEGDKIIIIKKIIVPKNSKIPEQYLQVGCLSGDLLSSSASSVSRCLSPPFLSLSFCIEMCFHLPRLLLLSILLLIKNN